MDDTKFKYDAKQLQAMKVADNAAFYSGQIPKIFLK